MWLDTKRAAGALLPRAPSGSKSSNRYPWGSWSDSVLYALDELSVRMFPVYLQLLVELRTSEIRHCVVYHLWFPRAPRLTLALPPQDYSAVQPTYRHIHQRAHALLSFLSPLVRVVPRCLALRCGYRIGPSRPGVDPTFVFTVAPAFVSGSEHLPAWELRQSTTIASLHAKHTILNGRNSPLLRRGAPPA